MNHYSLIHDILTSNHGILYHKCYGLRYISVDAEYIVLVGEQIDVYSYSFAIVAVGITYILFI